MIFIDAAKVLSAAEPAAIVKTLGRAFSRPHHIPERLHYDLPGGDGAKLLLMPAWEQRASIGVKVLTVIPSNAGRRLPTIDGLYLLMDGRTGSPRALLSGPALTAVRTAGVCALAASVLARQDAKRLLMIGSGVLAPHLVRAYCAVRPIKLVILWARDQEKAKRLALALADLEVEIRIAEQLSDVLGQADIIASATSSRTPLVQGALVAPGTHVDLVGGFTPEMREADTDLFRRARFYVDTKAAFAESGDLLTPLRERAIGGVAPDLAALVSNLSIGRQGPDEITVFKSVGNALADLATAQHVASFYEKVTTGSEPIDS